MPENVIPSYTTGAARQMAYRLQVLKLNEKL